MFRTFVTDKEYVQSSLDTTARIIFERASSVISCGSSSNDLVFMLNRLSTIALESGYSNTVINAYFLCIDAENEKSFDEKDYGYDV